MVVKNERNLFLVISISKSCNHYFDHFMFVRTREDTVRCIVTSLTDENSTELAEVTGNKIFIGSYKLHEVSVHVTLEVGVYCALKICNAFRNYD